MTGLIARWRDRLPVTARTPIITLGEGNTPLVRADRIQLLSNRNEDIPDPVSTSLEQYRRVRDRIASCLRDVVRLVGGT